MLDNSCQFPHCHCEGVKRPSQSQASEMLKHGGQSDVLDVRTLSLNPSPEGGIERSSSRFTLHSSLKKRAAFTLAEILITLGIIGVVASMTIPVLISKYQLKVFSTAFKKQYAVLTDTIGYIALDSSLNRCYMYYEYSEINNSGYFEKVNDDCNALFSELVSKLNLTPVENKFGDVYKTDDRVIADGGNVINRSVKYLDSVKRSSAYLTKDGAIYFFDPVMMYISIDTNGYKGPNKWGYDVFFMMLTSNNNSNKIILSDGPASIVDKGGLLPRTILQNKESSKDQNFEANWY